MFETLPTGIEELDLVLGGGVRYPRDAAAFIFLTGGPGTGKTILGLELTTRAWLSREEGDGVFLFYSVEQSPLDLQRKLESDFGHYFGCDREVKVTTEGLIGKVQLEVEAPGGGVNRLLLLQANPAALMEDSPPDSRPPTVGIEWIQAEIGNLARVDNLVMVCLDNVGLLLSETEYLPKRAALLRVRRDLVKRKIHGIFIHEEAPGARVCLPSAEEFSTDILIRLSVTSFRSFKARMLEIEKARHQYYYRGLHHFSIVGKDIRRDQFLGARSEKAPGVHIYPSIPAQLSLLKDAAYHKRPPRGPEPLCFGMEELDRAFGEGSRPAVRSSTVLLAEPGTPATEVGLRFAARGRMEGERAFFVSTREDKDFLLRACARKPGLGSLLEGGGGDFHPDFVVQYLNPELIPPGKFTWDILNLVGASGPVPEEPPPHRRLVFDAMTGLSARFPLVEDPDFLVMALLDLLRNQGVSPLFIELVSPGERPSPALLAPYVSRFDYVIQLFFKEGEEDERPWCRIHKALGVEFSRKPFPLDLNS